MSWYAKKGQRKPGEEQPYSGGKLKLRLPFIHYPFEFPDFLQGAILCVVPMGITAAMTEVLGIPFEIAKLFANAEPTNSEPKSPGPLV